MELTRFDLKNQAIQERIAEALERIAEALERGLETKRCPLCGELLGPGHDERAGQCPGVAK